MQKVNILRQTNKTYWLDHSPSRNKGAIPAQRMALMVQERGIISTFCWKSYISSVYYDQCTNFQSIFLAFSFFWCKTCEIIFSYSLVTCEKVMASVPYSLVPIFLSWSNFIEHYLIKPFCQERWKGFGKIFSQENK